MNRRIVAILAVLAVLGLPGSAMAWGAAMHVNLASDLLGQLQLLPAATAAILIRHRRDYLFGNIAADVVLAKKWSRVRQFCHHWGTGLAMLAEARNHQGRAFALGYLSHLAADTVSHNKFLPRQMTMTRTTLSLGHLYWEMRADSMVAPRYWEELRRLLREVFDEHEACLQARFKNTFLPFTANWRVFYRLNRFLGQKMWRKTLDRWYNLSRWRLSESMLNSYRAECLERMRDVVARPRDSELLREDPNGNAALAYTKAQRRQLRQMARAGLVAPHVLYEAAVGHAPAPARGVRHRVRSAHES
ncbi:MAG TPA: zinc dependent phospholipase C family protein [Phycisphaerae bacterium]|nr:zinc dependent phospholipase C family protein [Phycisphaerae bacterium]HRY67422.1 zinc dependent phospholipase C family protein [Phycisphaerae bacterium]HSA28987.1 zinc dependent phospholipase C family protein [Phycisphaerae bacterium]